ncbi:MAG TPA: hypothetical protein VNZ52_06410, partial [Candidatus Thermoplasmatota archaeon]|nr:hypothetical protein [Candidatus Thermoplasmatota archaeon]
ALPAPGLDAAHDIDLYLYAPGAFQDGLLLGDEVLAQSTNSNWAPEALSYTVAAAGTYEVVVVGWTVAAPQAFSLTANQALAFAGESLTVGNAGNAIIA